MMNNAVSLPTPSTNANIVSLVWQLTKRDITSRYRGSILGIGWTFLNPLIMLSVYSFVFTVIFKARWGQTITGSQAEFALILFTGLMLHSFFSECILRAPTLILQHTNFVKKVIFPLDILPVTMVASASFHLLVSTTILLLACAAILHTIPWTLFFLPLLLLPFISFTLGIAWILASLGVYVRDIAQTMGILTTVLLFISPIFYPVSALPESIQWAIYLNPLSFMVEEMRAILLWGNTPHWGGIGLYSIAGFLSASIGYIWFNKTRRGFADVL